MQVTQLELNVVEYRIVAGTKYGKINSRNQVTIAMEDSVFTVVQVIVNLPALLIAPNQMFCFSVWLILIG